MSAYAYKPRLQCTDESNEVHMTARGCSSVYRGPVLYAVGSIAVPPPPANSAACETHTCTFESSDVSSSPQRLQLYSGATICMPSRVTNGFSISSWGTPTYITFVLKPMKLVLNFPYKYRLDPFSLSLSLYLLLIIVSLVPLSFFLPFCLSSFLLMLSLFFFLFIFLLSLFLC